MNEYRTKEQFESIVTETINGNWSTAAKQCVEYGFYATDLISTHEDFNNMGEQSFKEDIDIAILIESATELRYSK